MAIADPESIPLPGEIAADEESPFRRREKAVPVRRGRLGRMRRLIRWTLRMALVLPLLSYAGYRLAVFALASPRFMLTSGEDVLLAGNRLVPREEVLSALGISPNGKPGSGVNIFRLSLEEKRKRVESIPWVRSATLIRAYPHWLAVNLVERTPVAFVNLEGRVKLVDGEGVLLDKPERAAFDFPVLTGLDAAGSQSDRVARLLLFEEFSRANASDAAASGWLISEVNLGDPDDLKAILVQGRETLEVHFGRSDFQQRFHNFLALLPEVHKTNGNIDSIDLRYRNQVVVNPRTTPSGDARAPAPPATREE